MGLRRFRRHWVRPGPLLFWLLLFIGAGGIGLKLVDMALGPTVVALAEMKVRAAALELIHRVVVEEVARDVGYADLVTYRTDKDGRVTVVEVNTQAVNGVAARAVTVLEQELEGLAALRWDVPLGAASGTALLADTGPRIPVKLHPAGAVTAEIDQRFTEAGINQTRHTVVLRVKAQMRILVPLVAKETAVAAEYPLAEGIIVGPVPQHYWRGDIPRVLPVPGT